MHDAKYLALGMQTWIPAAAGLFILLFQGALHRISGMISFIAPAFLGVQLLLLYFSGTTNLQALAWYGGILLAFAWSHSRDQAKAQINSSIFARWTTIIFFFAFLGSWLLQKYIVAIIPAESLNGATI